MECPGLRYGSAFTTLEADHGEADADPHQHSLGQLQRRDPEQPGCGHSSGRARHPTLPHRPVFARLAGCRMSHSAPLHPCGLSEATGRSDGTKRGVEPFVAVPWDEALDMAADARRRVVAEHGNEAIFGGSYGW